MKKKDASEIVTNKTNKQNRKRATCFFQIVNGKDKG